MYNYIQYKNLIFFWYFINQKNLTDLHKDFFVRSILSSSNYDFIFVSSE